MSGSASDAEGLVSAVEVLSSLMLSLVNEVSVATTLSESLVSCQISTAAPPTKRAAATAPERARIRLRLILLMVASLFLMTYAFLTIEVIKIIL